MEMPELQDFSLVGGTALSLLYGHRISIDLDLFSNTIFENTNIAKALKNKFQGKFIMEEKQAITYFLDADESENPMSLKKQTWAKVQQFIQAKVSAYLK